MTDPASTTHIIGHPDTEAALIALFDERKRQFAKWGEQNHEPEKWYVILGEEFGEIGRAILEGRTQDIAEEVMHVCAVAFQWREAIERGKDGQ